MSVFTLPTKGDGLTLLGYLWEMDEKGELHPDRKLDLLDLLATASLFKSPEFRERLAQAQADSR